MAKAITTKNALIQALKASNALLEKVHDAVMNSPLEMYDEEYQDLVRLIDSSEYLNIKISTNEAYKKCKISHLNN